MYLVSRWLSQAERIPPKYTSFSLFDITEIFDLCASCRTPPFPSSMPDAIAVKSLLVDSIITSRHDPEYLKDIAKDLSWPEVKKKLIIPLLPDKANTMGMEFGEVLSELLLNKFHAYEIPIPKRRYTIRKNQTLPANDTLAVKIAANKIAEVCYIESKLRNVRDNLAAKEAYIELKEKYLEEIPIIINFCLRRLHESKHVLFDALKEYLRDRTATDDKDTFCIGLVFDNRFWSETILEKVQSEVEADKAKNLILPPLRILAVRIRELDVIVQEVFKVARTP